ncbi:3736_t:CDS:2 [Acaulospora morrowiae]|uniref:3736_t:CDS:1 n=1 Tax=Acaulospora morrowiae TaxID=94023 RepID=A0A9N9G344_9GLOM|nr:3736_t:CDS:2 [Acaulospora morrowiae]
MVLSVQDKDHGQQIGSVRHMTLCISDHVQHDITEAPSSQTLVITLRLKDLTMLDKNENSSAPDDHSVERTIEIARRVQQDREQIEQVAVQLIPLSIQGTCFCDPSSTNLPTSFDFFEGSLSFT